MGNNDTALKRYYHRVNKALPCPRKMKKQIVTQLKGSVTEYLEQTQDADFSAVQNHFGTPQQIASSYVDDQDTPALLRKISEKKRILAIVAGAMAVVLLVWIGAVAWTAKDAQKTTRGQIDVIVEMD